MKENQAIFEKTKNENLEAVKRLCSMFMTLAKMGLVLLKKLPWAKMGKVIMLLVTLITIVVAAFIKFFAENTVEAIVESDFGGKEPVKTTGGMWIDDDGSYTTCNTGGSRIDVFAQLNEHLN